MNADKSLYPLKFKPILKERIWGGTRLRTILGKETSMEHCGESWEISGLPGDVSIVVNGFLKNNNLQELIEVYMGDLVGDKVYQKFGVEFPVLIKFIDARDKLSIQVHPDDKLAKERHHSYGKTEMWYILDAGKNSELIIGFNKKMDKDKYLEALDNKELKNILNFEKVSKGDVFFIPAGRIHALGKDILLTEIQQTSDITYRIYDWDRTDANGKSRGLHTALAIDAIDYDLKEKYRTDYKKPVQGTENIVSCPYFNTDIVVFSQEIGKDYIELDSFVIYICLSGKCEIDYGSCESTGLSKGETILVPASLKNIRLIPSEPTEILEVCIR